MKCMFCKDEVKDYDAWDVHLVIARSVKGHTHIHGDIDDKEEMRLLLKIAARELGLVAPVPDTGASVSNHQKDKE